MNEWMTGGGRPPDRDLYQALLPLLRFSYFLLLGGRGRGAWSQVNAKGMKRGQKVEGVKGEVRPPAPSPHLPFLSSSHALRIGSAQDFARSERNACHTGYRDRYFQLLLFTKRSRDHKTTFSTPEINTARSLLVKLPIFVSTASTGSPVFGFAMVTTSR